ncbi:hypothetical protein ACNOYE_23855 [Nannocystaceae bacterium ST9]
MADAIIDTNVLLVASAADPGSPFADTHLTPAEQLAVLDWVLSFHRSAEQVVLDNGMTIHDEYYNKMTGQDFGMIVITEKLQSARLHVIEYDADGHGVVPAAFAALDRSDRKFLAVALADLDAGDSSEIVNATDTLDWNAIAAACEAHGITIRHLLGGR